MEPNGKTINPPVIGETSQVAAATSQPAAVPQNAGQVPVQQTATSEETKTIVTVLLLIFAYPIGLIVAWIWPKWKWWVKLLISIPVVFVILAVLLFITLIAINPAGRMQQAAKAQFMNQCVTTYTQQQCEEQYSQLQLNKLNEFSVTTAPVE